MCIAAETVHLQPHAVLLTNGAVLVLLWRICSCPEYVTLLGSLKGTTKEPLLLDQNPGKVNGRLAAVALLLLGAVALAVAFVALLVEFESAAVSTSCTDKPGCARKGLPVNLITGRYSMCQLLARTGTAVPAAAVTLLLDV